MGESITSTGSSSSGSIIPSRLVESVWESYQQAAQQSYTVSRVQRTDEKDSASVSPQAAKKAEKEKKKPARSFGDDEEYTQEQLRQISDLKEQDRKVRAHEQAHLMAAGSLAKGGANYEFENGPDQHRYAVGGEVSIDTSPVDGDPEATIQKAAHIKRAALAPADPSPQDRSVAAEADSMAMKAHLELLRQQSKEASSLSSTINVTA